MPGEEITLGSFEDYRTFFASLIIANGGVSGAGDLKAAFASTPRERFLGKGPWKVLTAAGYLDTPSDDPIFVYLDAAIAIDPETKINNGQPSLHARCIAALQIKESETIAHIGAGTGYYTAILARLTKGNVYAFEIEPGLASRAKENLADLEHVTVRQRSGADGELPLSDVIYVSAGTTEPHASWLGALGPGGRLLFPLTGDKYAGGMLLVQRWSPDLFSAKFITPVMFIPCTGARDEVIAQRLSEAFNRGDLKKVQSLRRNMPPDDTCWFAGPDWWLSTSPAG